MLLLTGTMFYGLMKENGHSRWVGHKKKDGCNERYKGLFRLHGIMDILNRNYKTKLLLDLSARQWI